MTVLRILLRKVQSYRYVVLYCRYGSVGIAGMDIAHRIIKWMAGSSTVCT